MPDTKIIIFDLDGTLYQIDGKSNGYVGSTLEKSVQSNALEFIMSLDKSEVNQAQETLQEALVFDGGMSWFFIQKYGIERQSYFERVWNIPPNDIVQNFEVSVEVVQQVKDKGNYLILLTAAPTIWQKTVISFLGLEGIFDEIYTSDSFKKKDEVFEKISERFPNKNILSVGDQHETDIEPAARLGFSTLHIQSPDDVKQVLEFVRTS